MEEELRLPLQNRNVFLKRMIAQAYDLISALEIKGTVHNAFYVRTSDQREIDLIQELPGERWAIEVKLTSRPSRDDLASLNRNADLIEADKRFLVCRSSDLVQSGSQTVCDLEGMLECLP